MATTKRVGDRVGPYKLTAVLGVGGAGQVFRAAWNPNELERAAASDDHPQEVAIKLMRPDMAANEGAFRRFVREIGVAQSIHHPNIIRHVDSGLADEYLYYAMEVVPFGTMRDVLDARGRLKWRDAVEAAMHVADALGALHNAGVLHRDLKPENVFLSEDGKLKLGDFGLARKEDAQQLTMAGQTVGSVRYMSPEQVCGSNDLDGRCDLYALGCVLMEMITGESPFEEGDVMTIFYKHVEEPPPKLRSREPLAPLALEEVLDRLLAKERDDRPPNADAVREMLAALLTSETMEIGSLDGLMENHTPALITPMAGDTVDPDEAFHSKSSDSLDSGISAVLDRELGAIDPNFVPQAEEETAHTRPMPTGLAQRLAEPDPTAPQQLLSPTAWILIGVGIAVIGLIALFGGDLGFSGTSKPTIIIPNR